MNNINFTGTYIKPATVYKGGEKVHATVIELDKRDVKAVGKIVDKWDTWITNLIYAKFFKDPYPKEEKFFAISTQTSNFQKVEPAKVLALFNVRDDKTKYTLDYIEVKPNSQFNPLKSNKKRTGFSQVGKACYDFVKEKFASKKETDLFAVDSAKAFYEKMGAVKSESKDGNRYIIV